MWGEGRQAAGQQAVPKPPAKPDAEEAITQVEVVVHRVVPETSTYLMGDEIVFVTRDEADMLEDLRVDGYEPFGRADSHSVWITLVNHTDTGYLLSEYDVYQLAYGIAYADADGRAWRTRWTVLDTHAAYDGAFTIPLAPRGRREMILPVGFMRFDPPEDPERPGHELAFPPTLLYHIKAHHVRARPVVRDTLGDFVQLNIDGRGNCEVSFDGPM